MIDKKDTFLDPLLECLLFLTRKEQRPFSSSALTAGLPLVEHKLNPELFIRAATRAGFASRVIERPLYRFSQLVLPAVLLLHDNRACLLLEFDRKNNTATIMVPESGGETSVDLETLAGEYSGYAIFVKAEHQFDQRSRESLVEKQGKHWFWSVIFRSWRIYRDVLLASLLINIFAVVSPLYTMNIYDRVVPNRAMETLWVMSIGFIVLMIFDLILKILRSYFIDLAGKKADTILLARLFEHVLSLRMSHQPSSVGVFANQLKEFDSVRGFITSTTITALVDLPFAFLFLIVMGIIGGVMAFVPLLAVPVVLIYGAMIQPALQAAVTKSYMAGGQKNAMLIETLSGLETIKALEAESRVQRTWESLVGQMAVWGQKSRLLSGSVSHVTGFVQSIVTVGLVVVGVYRISAGELSMGALIACVMLGSRILVPMGQVVNLMVNYFQAKTSLQSLENIMQLPLERHEGESHLHKPDIDGDIQFRDVTFSYPGQQVPALKHVSFAIKKGERVAIIGRVGSGKSTIQKLILGLYEPAEGAVLIDGLDVRQLDPADLRRNIGFVPQDVILFYGSVKENITYSVPFAEDAAMIAAADASGASDFVRQHPKGFDMPVGERGELLSGGQRQSVGVARALLKNPSVFLLDEPTSSMDNSTEEWIKKNIASYLEGHTAILVTHKMSMLSLVDRVIVMERGKILADGPREEILEALRQGKIRGSIS